MSGIKATRKRAGNQFFITLREVDNYSGVRQDILYYFDFVTIISFCVGLEENKSVSKEQFHMHIFLDLEEKLFLDDLRLMLDSFWYGKYDLQSCRSKRNVLKYVSKTDFDCYHNVSVDLLSSGYQMMFWARNTVVFKITDPYVVTHNMNWKFLKSLHERVQFERMKNFKGYERVYHTYGGWSLLVGLWWNEIIKLKGYRQPQLYLYGGSGLGKTEFIERIIKCYGMRVYNPLPGRFFFEDFDVEIHKVILFEEFNWKRWESNESQLKRLLEWRDFSVDQKCIGGRKIVVAKVPIIFVSNYEGDEMPDAIKNRLKFVNADEIVYRNGLEPLHEIKEEICEEGQEEVVCISSDEEDTS